MKAILLAGGEGTRLRPLTAKLPKPMVPLFGRPVLEHLLLLLRRHGINQAAVTLGYLPQAVTDYFGDGSAWGMSLTYLTEETPLGTAGAVRAFIEGRLYAETLPCKMYYLNNPIFRFVIPDPHFTIHPDTAKKLGIKANDWCWIETRRGRIKQRANVEPSLDPRVIYTQRGWWFPERSHEGFQPFGCMESNTNMLTSVDDEDCCPMTGCWANRGLLCKVYKCTEMDHEFTYEDSLYSIPGNRREPGIDWDYVKNPPRALPFNEPIFAQPDFEVPAGLEWDYKTRKAWNAEKTQYFDAASGWMIGKDNGAYYQYGTGYRYLALDGVNYLVDEANDVFYDFSGAQVATPAAPVEVPEGLKYDFFRQKVVEPSTGYYLDASGWLIEESTGSYYERYTLRKYDATLNVLVDQQTGKFYSMQDPAQ